MAQKFAPGDLVKITKKEMELFDVNRYRYRKVETFGLTATVNNCLWQGWYDVSIEGHSEYGTCSVHARSMQHLPMICVATGETLERNQMVVLDGKSYSKAYVEGIL